MPPILPREICPKADYQNLICFLFTLLTREEEEEEYEEEEEEEEAEEEQTYEYDAH